MFSFRSIPTTVGLSLPSVVGTILNKPNEEEDKATHIDEDDELEIPNQIPQLIEQDDNEIVSYLYNILGLEPDAVVHKLPLKPGYKPMNQRLRRMNSPCNKRGDIKTDESYDFCSSNKTNSKRCRGCT
ncbi:hypothetical protein M9H77_35531 [Catharanthus roseus]|uniref:Uncharacterized protein n=1 Tax=Catharanthus roseus TaxID=4058 RepID=A0ACB9ZRU0_CATRO|nr:hypothetical protein M9H77_35531 [Catharanthus roseus]